MTASSMNARFPDLFPEGAVLPEHQTFWAHCAQQRLCMQRCNACDAWRHPPSPMCPQCGSADSRWEPVRGAAALFSFTVVHHPASPGLRDAVPYNIAIVSFEGLGNARLISRVTDVAPDGLRIGMPLLLHWQHMAQGTGPVRWLPLFRPRLESGCA